SPPVGAAHKRFAASRSEPHPSPPLLACTRRSRLCPDGRPLGQVRIRHRVEGGGCHLRTARIVHAREDHRLHARSRATAGTSRRKSSAAESTEQLRRDERGNVDGPDSGERTDHRRTRPLAAKSGRCAPPCARLCDLASVPSRHGRAERGPRAMTQTRGDLRRFDPEAVHAKYEEERGKRMVAGRAEIRDLTSERAFAHYLEDPFTPYARRDPLSDDVDVAIVGAGIPGVCAG